MNVSLIVPAYPGMVPSIHPPLGLILLRSILKENCGLNVAIVDGFQVTEETVYSLAKEFALVGIQIHSLNVQPAIKLGRALRSQGCLVVIGGPEVTLSDDLTWADDAYDIAVRNHAGEMVASAIKSLYESSSGAPRVVIGDSQPRHRINYEGLDLSLYWSRAKLARRSLKHAPVITHLGCSFRDRSQGGCTFCADIGERVSIRKSEDINAEIQQLSCLYNVQAFYCVGENLARGLTNRLSKTVNPPRDSVWSFFARASEINKEIVQKMYNFGIREIRVGAESGDNAVLANTAKGETTESIETAIKLLNDYGILASVSFVLGLPGETKLSLERTYRIAQRWTVCFPNLSISSSVILPIPGSRLGKLAGVLPGIGITEAHQRDFITRFTSVTWSDIEKYGNKLSKLPSASDPAVSHAVATWQPATERCKNFEAIRCA
jgi:radical SAM superfamily enzyme YgiQ (UPF0313 family)